jgi:hypothetical protein
MQVCTWCEATGVAGYHYRRADGRRGFHCEAPLCTLAAEADAAAWRALERRWAAARDPQLTLALEG